MSRESPPGESSFARRIVRRGMVFVLVIVVAASGGAAYLAKQLYDGAETLYRAYGEDAVIVDIRPGMSTSAIGQYLVAAGVVRDENTFRMAVWRSGRERGLQAGEYRFAGAISAMAVIDVLTQGQVYLRPITFPEGLTRRQMAELFGASDFGSAEAFLAASDRAELIAALDPEAQNLEGYLFPETYSLPRGATADDLVEAMVAQFETTFDQDLRQRATELELSVREVVTLASLSQRETGLDEERSIVSAVYTNRLRRRMPLQCDPTVIYALELADLYDGNLTRENLRFDSPYNTYVYAGLPPGPIAAPGGADLRAALHPAEVAHLYFVSRNNGSHVFADTLRQHNRNVREYQVEYFRRRRAGGR